MLSEEQRRRAHLGKTSAIINGTARSGVSAERRLLVFRCYDLRDGAALLRRRYARKVIISIPRNQNQINCPLACGARTLQQRPLNQRQPESLKQPADMLLAMVIDVDRVSVLQCSKPESSLLPNMVLR
jgi:hypothetical protein